MFQEMLAAVRNKGQLIHCITNYVTANDCANILLACGASPIMADDAEEAMEITAACDALVLNLGTLHSTTVPAMLAAGKKANELGHPVVLDPVGVGASGFRTQTARLLLQEIRFALVRGNASEIRTLCRAEGGTADRITGMAICDGRGDNAGKAGGAYGREKGVDAAAKDQVTEENLRETETLVREFARNTGAVTALTGAIDLVTDGGHCFRIRNGCPQMRRVTGTGCQLSALAAAYLAANPGETLRAAAAAVCAMGLCGERALARMQPGDGNASFRAYLIDAVYNLQPEDLEKGANYEMQ